MNRPIIISLIIIIIAVSGLLLSCGNDNIINQNNNQTTFETIIDYTEDVQFNTVVECTHGSIVVGGRNTLITIDSSYSTTDSVGIGQAFLVKLNKYGDTVWTTSFGEDTLSERVQKIVLNADGNFMVLAIQSDWNRLSNNNLYIQFVSADGILGSHEIIEDISWPYIKEIIQTEDNGYIIVGGTNGFMRPSHDMVVIKINSYGLKSWSKIYERGLLTSVKLLENGNFLTAGEKYDDLDHTYSNYIMKINSVGDSLEAVEISLTENDRLKNIKIVDNNQYKIVGGTGNNGNSLSDFMLNLDSTLSPIKTQIHYVQDYFWLNSSDFSSDGGSLFYGSSNNPADLMFLTKYDASNNFVWQQQYVKTDYRIIIQDMIPLSDGGYAMTGYCDNNATSENVGFILKVDAEGNVTLK